MRTDTDHLATVTSIDGCEPDPSDSHDREVRAAQSDALWRMSVEERARAMWEGRLSFAQLREWSSLRPDQVPKIGHEFAWIVMKTPDWADAGEGASDRVPEDLAA